MKIKDLTFKNLSIERKLDLRIEPPRYEDIEVSMRITLERRIDNKLLFYVTTLAESKSLSIIAKLYVLTEGEREEIEKIEKMFKEKRRLEKVPELDEIFSDVARRILAIEVMLAGYMKLPLLIPPPKTI